jgi:hypothetical protein
MERRKLQNVYCVKWRQAGCDTESDSFCIYIDGLLCNLRDRGVGCYIGDIFIGALAYTDDISLLSPTPSGMRKLLSICENYANEFKILFNAAKSKCIFIAPSKYRTDRSSPIPEFYVSGHRTEYTDHWPHLGHIIDNNSDDQEDILQQRNKLCGQNNVLCILANVTYLLNKSCSFVLL